MERQKLQRLYLCRIRREEAVGFTALSPDIYHALFQFIDVSPASNIALEPAREFRLSPSSIKPLADRFASALSAKRKVECRALLLEMLDSEADVHAYDDLCEAIHLAIRSPGVTGPQAIVIAVSNSKIFQDSLLLNRRLLPECERKRIGLILLSFADEVVPLILCQGNLPVSGELDALQHSGTSAPQEALRRLSLEEITAEFQLLFGHFEVGFGGAVFHVPAIASVRRLAVNLTFVNQLRSEISDVVRPGYAIMPLGIPGGGILELALSVVDGDSTRLVDVVDSRSLNTNALLILCDFLAPIYSIDSLVREARSRGVKEVAVASIARYQDAPSLDVPTMSYLKTNYVTTRVPDSVCRFCEQGVPAVRRDHFDAFAREVREFEPFTFWEFVSQSPDFVRIGHWPSDRTPNHYLFRIMTDPIFKQHRYGVAIRLRNALASRGVLPDWVRKIVCTEGEESSILSTTLAQELGLRDQDVVRIPRKFFDSIAGKELDQELTRYIDTNYGANVLSHQNVLIVDQAAHHFGTLSALRQICAFYDCIVLAFAVFIDRADTALSLGEYLHDCHYVALYSWPVPPRRAWECVCTGERTS